MYNLKTSIPIGDEGNEFPLEKKIVGDKPKAKTKKKSTSKKRALKPRVSRKK